jgi:hypothetical protein
MNQNPAPAPVWYNTTGQTDPELTLLRNNAMSQQERVLAYMKSMKGYRVTAWHVQQHVLQHAPITSVRRCLTNLAADGHLKVVGKTEDGPYEHTCNQYTVAA